MEASTRTSVGTAVGLTLLLLPMLLGRAAAQQVPYVAWGKELFAKYCVSCHGPDGGGNGPAAVSLKTAPSDLRHIRKTHGGHFSHVEVAAFIDGEKPIPAHGSRDLPVWGRVFQEEQSNSFARATARAEIYALTDYLESIQVE